MSSQIESPLTRAEKINRLNGYLSEVKAQIEASIESPEVKTASPGVKLDINYIKGDKADFVRTLQALSLEVVNKISSDLSSDPSSFSDEVLDELLEKGLCSSVRNIFDTENVTDPARWTMQYSLYLQTKVLDVCISHFDVQYFFQNNQNLRDVDIEGILRVYQLYVGKKSTSVEFVRSILGCFQQKTVSDSDVLRLEEKLGDSFFTNMQNFSYINTMKTVNDLHGNLIYAMSTAFSLLIFVDTINHLAGSK